MPNTYDEQYVLKLRDEAKKYRLQLRELQAQMGMDTQDEAAQPEAPAEPDITAAPVTPADESTSEAPTKTEDVTSNEEVAKPATEIAPETEVPADNPEATEVIAPEADIATPLPLAPAKSTVGAEPKTALDSLKSRQVSELESDPEARAKLRDLYRTMLRTPQFTGK